MAESRTVAVAPLNGSNNVTWKIQCKMAPLSTDPGYKRFVERRDKVLAIVVLSIDPTLLYLIGEPTDPKAVWTTLADQFQKKTWANSLISLK